MSLLQNEDFVLYQLRTAYLSCIKDGVGERLITVDSTVLNNPAFRAAGWVPNAADIRRTYSPPIPTAITSDYFQAPRSAGLKEGFGEDDEEGGMVTGGGSNDTVGPALNTSKRRRRKEQMDEDDSSDLSDESDDDADATRPANQIKFTKMPLRTRAGSSPIRGSHLHNTLLSGSNTQDGPSLMITSPSRPPDSRLRRGSLGAIETIKERARRDTVTSSEMSSENELDPVLFQRKKLNPHRAAKASQLLSERIQEDDREGDAHLDDRDQGNESDDSTLSSEFAGTADTNSILGDVGNPMDSSPRTNMSTIPPPITPFNASPKKIRQAAPMLQALPPPRPISVLQPVSALTLALKAKDKKPEDPLQRFATLSGKGDPNPLYIRIYAPFSSKPNKPFEVLLRKTLDDNTKVTVSEAIGLALYRYNEEKLEPPLPPQKQNVNRWVFRMYEDDEVDMEFPALARTKEVTDFASNNSRGMRARSREKPWDEFALVEANEREFADNEKLTPRYSKEAAAATEAPSKADPFTTSTTGPNGRRPSMSGPAVPPKPPPAPARSFRNPITGPLFAPSNIRKDSTNLLDAPAVTTSHATPRTGAPKTIAVHFTDDNFQTRHMAIPCTTDTYIAEVFDRVCHELRVDKALYVLKVSGTATVAPADRTVEALGSRTDLDLARRRFIGDGAYGLSGSPGSESPNAPLLINTPGGVTKKGHKKAAPVASSLMHPLSQNRTPDAFLAANANYRRYAVTRKQPMSFSSSSARILALDGEYMHIMPGESTNNPHTKHIIEGAGGKTTTVHFSSVVGSKVSRRHPRMFRVVVFKERETKRYDFEAQGGAQEAREIVEEIRRGVERFQEGVL
ncbi:SIN1-domain-containing protein [Lophium mytilinum]|uniref:SIN1-domain-containing protein n=1 Tax=Lophium mytilinum TaxID=390894 RepID=A0A6A6R0C7_9PEZI|nr:SIN1-domain-containing protein [Lophium mytilinum]